MLTVSSVQDDLSTVTVVKRICVYLNKIYDSVNLKLPTSTTHMDLFIHHAYCPTLEIDELIAVANRDLLEWEIATKVDAIEVVLSKVFDCRNSNAVLEVNF